MEKYVRLTKSVKDFGILIPEDKVLDHINSEQDWYQSCFYYNQEHFKKFQEVGSVKGFKDTVTNKLWFDFDNEKDPSQAQRDAGIVYNRLIEAGLFNEEIEIYFSGFKGFNLIVKFDRWLTPSEVANLALKYTKGVTLDTSMYDGNQILRVPATRHPKTGLYKIPLTADQLFNSSINSIKFIASNLDHITDEFNWKVSDPSDDFFEIPKVKTEIKSVTSYTLNLADKPNNWKNCKWSLLQGNFKEKERHEAMMVIAATCRGMGYDKLSTYYLAKSALKKQSTLTGQEEFPKEELWKNIIEDSIFKDGWEGGQYSCKTNPWLRNYCDSLGEFKCKNREEDDSPAVSLSDMATKFTDYAVNFETNIVKTGLKELDENALLMASTLNGLLAAPGSGKTTKALNFLKNTSANNIQSHFFSMDMGLPIIYANLVKKKTGQDFRAVLQMFKNDKVKAEQYISRINQEYKNVLFNFKSGLTTADMKRIIQEGQEQTGKQTKLVVIDYLECMASPFGGDDTANVGFICNQLKDLANDLNTCVLLLLQTQKHSTKDISDPLLSMRNIKGSSIIEQSMSVILTMWREGYNPETVNDDRYASFAIVKNRFGPLWRGDFAWRGTTGDITSMTEEQRIEFEEFKNRKKAMRLQKLREESGGWE